MAMVSRTRNFVESFVRECSFKWLTKARNSFDDDVEELRNSPSAEKSWITELSPVANIVVNKCSKIIGLSVSKLRDRYGVEASARLKNQSSFPRNFLEYCSFMTLARVTQVNLDDSDFRRLTFYMMVAWEFPAASDEVSLGPMDDDATVVLEAFTRIAPAVPLVANVVVADKIFEVLAASTGARLHFSVYDKYLVRLERTTKKVQSQSESSLLYYLRSRRGEKILEIDGTVTTQPVLEHAGVSTWPGRLTLTDHALYFEALRVVSYDKAKVYDLADELQQIVKPELTGPWGTRLFDKAICYRSISLSEPAVMEFPELKGHNRRDYWLAIIREILYVHRFINKFQISSLQRDEVLLKAVFGILRVQALKDMSLGISLHYEDLLTFNLCDQLPCGDLILEKFANTAITREIQLRNAVKSETGMYSVSALTLASGLGFTFGTNSSAANQGELLGDEIVVGEMTPLEKVVKEARSGYANVVHAQSTVDGVKVEGIDTNLAVMKELFAPMRELYNRLIFIYYWEDPLKSLGFCLFCTYVICRGWLAYMFAALLTFFALFMFLNRCCGQGSPVDELKVIAPPPMNAMEQLLAVQNAISHAEELIQEGNIVLLKCRALLLSIFPQATERFAVAVLILAVILAFVPHKFIILLAFVEAFTRYSPLRRIATERGLRRVRDWWFSIPAAPVLLQRVDEDKKKR